MSSRSKSSWFSRKSGSRHSVDDTRLTTAGDGESIGARSEQSSLAPGSRVSRFVKRAVSPSSWRNSKSANSSTAELAMGPSHPSHPAHPNISHISSNSPPAASVVAGIGSPTTLVATGPSPVIVCSARDIDANHSTKIQGTASSSPPTGGGEENGNNGTPHDLVANPTFSQQAPLAEPVFQPPAIIIGACTPQSHSVEELSTEEQISPPCQTSLHDSKGVTGTLPTLDPPSQVWERTLDIAEKMLQYHGLPALNRDILKSPSAAENIQFVLGQLKACTDQEDDQKEKRERWGRILRGVEKYTKIVDTAVQHSPEVTALVWAGIRGILQISLNHLEAVECLEETMTTVMMKVSMCEFYAGIYEGAIESLLNSKAIQDTLFSALPEFNASVIVFSIKAREYFQARWIKKFQNLLKPFDIEFGPFIDEINAKEKVIRDCADSATMDRIRRMENQIGEIRSEIQPLVKLNQEIATNVAENLEITKGLQTTALDDKTYELLRQLSPLEPLKRHDDIRLTRVDNTGTWLLQLDSFCNWRNNGALVQTDRVFCCYGIPGAGKTVMSSILIDDLSSRLIKPSMAKVGIAYLYSDYRDQNAQTLIHILGTLLQQFLRGIFVLPVLKDVRNSLESIKKAGRNLSKDDLLTFLQTSLQYLERSFICIDALDELETKTRSQLLQAINHLVAQTDKLRVFLTGRRHIQEEVQKLSKISVDIVAHPDDIRSYLKKEIEEDENPDAMDEALQNEIVTSLVERSQQMFLLPALHIKMVLEMTTKSQRRKALKLLPPDLYKTLEAVITRMQTLPSSKAKLGMQVLQWLHFAYRPLKLVELQHALSVEAGQTEFDPDNVPSSKVIVDSCLGLVILDEETKTIRFVHYTLEEYFRSRGDEYFPNGCNDAAEICLTYLNFGELVPHCITLEELDQRMENFAFLEYAAVNWGFYVARQCNDIVKTLALKVLGQTDRTPCPLQVLYQTYNVSNGLGRRIVIKFSGVHVAAYFGLVECLQYLCPSMGAAMGDETCRTPLSWAAENGHKGVVQLLLARDDVDVNSKESEYGQTPLSLAAEKGHKGVVQLLLARDDVDVNSKDPDYDRTPLSWAAEEGHERVVQLLLARDDVDVNSKDPDFDQTPLSLAAGRGHERVVQLLLARDDVDVNSKDLVYGRTPLSLAARYECGGVVQLLLARDDVDVNSKDNYRQTPLTWAAENGHERVVQLLLARDDVDVNSKGSSCLTPLSLAAEKGHERVMQLLLARDDVDVNSKGSSCLTPLSWAAEKGHEGVVQLLLARDDVDVNSEDDKFRTPLALAAKNGHEGVVQLLLARDDVDVDSKDSIYGRTPLSWAARNGHERVVQLLLARDDVDVSSKGSSCQTPLSLAARNGHERVVQLLIARDDVDVDSKDPMFGQTPLSWAAENGHERVVQLLLARDDVDVDSKDLMFGRTPLSLAAGNGHERVVQLLLARDDVDVDSKDSRYGRTPLSWAAKNGREGVVQLLLARDDVDVNSKDDKLRTPLALAAKNGHEGVVQLLLARDDVDVDSKSLKGRTPLSLAAEKGHERVMQLLLARDDVDVNSKGSSCLTPLSWAAEQGHERVVQLLLPRDDVDVDSKDPVFGQTPLSWAALNGHEGVVQLLLARDDVDANSKDSEYGQTLLSWAAYNGRERVVQLLLARDDVDVNATDNDGKTAVDYAREYGHDEIVRLLSSKTLTSSPAV